MRLGSLVLVAASTLVLAGCNAQSEAKRETPARPVLVAEMHYAPRDRDRLLPGIVKARVESDLGFRVAGKIARRLVDAGAFVKQGQVLAVLDDTDFHLQVEQAEADYSAAKSSRDQAEAELGRIETLHRQGWSASADFDKAESAADQARSVFTRAERAATLARDALSYATLVADADGVVSAILAERGQVVASGAPVVHLAHTGEKEAVVAVPEGLVERVKASPARVEFWALPGVSIVATLRELSPDADTTTRTYQARYTLASAPANAQLGMSASVILAGDGERIAHAPLGALFDQGGGPTLWTVDPASGAVASAKVHVVGYDNDSALISDGVAEGALVVALGAQKLDPSQKVRIVKHVAGL